MSVADKLNQLIRDYELTVEERVSIKEKFLKATNEIATQRDNELEKIKEKYEKKYQIIKKEYEPEIISIKTKLEDNVQERRNMKRSLKAAQVSLKGDPALRDPIDYKRDKYTIIDTPIDKPFLKLEVGIIKGNKPVNKYELHLLPHIGRVAPKLDTGINPYRTCYKSFPTEKEAKKYYTRNQDKILQNYRDWVEIIDTEINNLIKEYGKDSVLEFDFRLALEEKWSGEHIIDLTKDIAKVNLTRCYSRNTQNPWSTINIDCLVYITHKEGDNFDIQVRGNREVKQNHIEDIVEHFKHRLSSAPICWIENPNIKVVK